VTDISTMVPRRPAQSLGERIKRRLIPLAVLFGAAIVLAGVGFVWLPGSLVAMGLMLALVRLEKGPLNVDNDLKGRLGEKDVASVLKGLPEGYTVLHDVEMEWGNIDHVVVGPTGVFAIETKNWNGGLYRKQGRLMHRGHPQDHVIRQATSGAMDLKRRLASIDLKAWVSAIVVSTGGPVTGSPLTIRNVTVVGLGDPVSVITSGRTSLDSQQVTRAVAAILRGGQPLKSRAISYP